MVRCPRCLGRKNGYVDFLSGHQVVCDLCNNTGYLELLDVVGAQPTASTRMHEDDAIEVDCTACDGKGYIIDYLGTGLPNQTCRKCGGAKKVKQQMTSRSELVSYSADQLIAANNTVYRDRSGNNFVPSLRFNGASWAWDYERLDSE